MAQFAPQYSLYKITNTLKEWLDKIFWLVFALSILPLIITYFGIKVKADDLINTINIIAIGIVFAVELLVEFILVPLAESRRRDDFIDNCLGSSFSPNSSIGYYDNDELNYGLYKVAANQFENCFFTYSLSKAIIARKIVVPAVIMLSVAICAYYGFKQVPFALSLLQVLFSMNILGALVKHCILLSRLHCIQDDWINLFQQLDFKIQANKYQAHVYRYWLQYETLHSRIQAGVPEKTYNKLNPKLTQEWIAI